MYKVLLVLFTLLVLAFSLTACISFGGHEEANNCLHPDFEETVVEATCYADGEVCKVCKVCGYVYEGESLPADYRCPLCNAPAEKFELIQK